VVLGVMAVISIAQLGVFWRLGWLRTRRRR
jgi:hypothetical protein